MRKRSQANLLYSRICDLTRTRTLRVTYGLPASEKATWGQGPWIDEPDWASWIDNRTLYPCAVMRDHAGGSWCGYVGVPSDHLMHGVQYSSGFLPMFLSLIKGEQPNFELTPHEGVNWSGPLPWDHTDPHWYFGYDCAHAGDYMPRLEAMLEELAANDPKLKRIRRSMQRLMNSVSHMQAEAGEGADGMLESLLRPVYRPIEYCVSECAKLAQQLLATKCTKPRTNTRTRKSLAFFTHL